MTENQKIEDWTTDFSNEATQNPKFQLIVDDTAEILTIDNQKVLGVKSLITFQDNGEKMPVHAEYGQSYKFLVTDSRDEKEKTWFINKKQWSLLKEISNHAPLTGKKALVQRIGKGRADTKWFITFQ